MWSRKIDRFAVRLHHSRFTESLLRAVLGLHALLCLYRYIGVESESQRDFLADEVAFLVTANGSICDDWKWGDFGQKRTKLGQKNQSFLFRLKRLDLSVWVRFRTVKSLESRGGSFPFLARSASPSGRKMAWGLRGRPRRRIQRVGESALPPGAGP